MSEETGFDKVPERYATESGREAIDIIRDSMTDSEFISFCTANAMKYQMRLGKKGSDDAEKARWYTEMASHVEQGTPDPRSGRPRFTPYVRVGWDGRCDKGSLIRMFSGKNTIRVLDHGFVELIDVMGDDLAIEEMARTSYQQGTRPVSDTRALIRYLVANRHTSPLEGCEIKIRVKLPIFVARQFVRHRTANINELSARFSIVRDEFYSPDLSQVCYQATDNKQGRSGALPAADAAHWRDEYEAQCAAAFAQYALSVSDGEEEAQGDPGVARETARMVLPLSTYTTWIWKCDLHNMLHFLSLRMDPHAQWEIRVYANWIAEIVRKWVPLAWEAFEDYRLHAITFSRMEVEVLRRIADILTSSRPGLFVRGREENLPSQLLNLGCTRREVAAFLKKLNLKLTDG